MFTTGLREKTSPVSSRPSPGYRRLITFLEVGGEAVPETTLFWRVAAITTLQAGSAFS